MRLMSRFLVLVPAMAMCCAIFPQITQQPTITIDSKSQNFSSGEVIPIHIVLKNTTDQNFSVFRSIGGTLGEAFFSISVTGPDGNAATLTKYGEAIQKKEVTPISRIMKTVAPGESIDENIIVDHMFNMTLPGTYVIQVSRASPLDPAVTLKSNTLTIGVDH